MPRLSNFSLYARIRSPLTSLLLLEQLQRNVRRATSLVDIIFVYQLLTVSADDLYTKITGGQRVDLFGAQKADLPSIWKELIDAGFESGHGYGKALRTVKSCVGTNWCRYGIGDSVGCEYKNSM